jgi:hypothetical protein
MSTSDLSDVVYLVRSGDRNEELRYSLRSLTNLPHRKVWLAGFQPSWTVNVGRIPVTQRRGKWDNQEANIRAACLHPDVSDPFILFNDDFFVMQPTETVPVLHRGTFAENAPRYVRRNDEYGRRMKNTHRLLGDDALVYDAIHVPMTFHKRPLLDALGVCRRMLFRSVYGNREQVGGTLSRDCKIRGSNLPDRPFVSTSDGMFSRKPAGKQIRGRFTERSMYEC